MKSIYQDNNIKEAKKLIHDKQKKIFKKLSLKNNKKSILTLFYKMTVNHGTKKLQAPSRGYSYIS